MKSSSCNLEKAKATFLPVCPEPPRPDEEQLIINKSCNMIIWFPMRLQQLAKFGLNIYMTSSSLNTTIVHVHMGYTVGIPQ